MNFEKWLVKQKKRDDIVGDLAQDFIKTGLKCIEESFRHHPPCSGALDAYKEARAEFDALYGI